ncbi:MAG: metal-sensitive transcriptional regulator [Gorillibacterium sp.]|nr:metal-sensitive transcriptional regulator [Gorillibacterium sp.]
MTRWDLKSNLLSSLNCVEGQVRDIKGMVDKDAYCIDVLNQIAATRAALNSMSKLVLENEISSCLTEKISGGKDESVDELMTTIGRLL